MLGKETFIAYKQEDNYSMTWSGTHSQFAYPLPGSRPSTNVNMRRKEFISSTRSNPDNFLQESVRSVSGGYSFHYSSNLFPLLALAVNLNENYGTTLTLDDSPTIKSINVLEVFSPNKMVNFSGMCISDSTINISSLESIVGFNVNFIGVKEEPNTFSGNLPNYHINPHLTPLPYNILYPSYLSTLKIENELLPFQSFSLTINNNILEGEFLSDTGMNVIKPKVGIREITGNYTMKFDTIGDMNFFDVKIRNSVDEELVLTLKDENNENPLIFTMNKVQYNTGSQGSINLGELTLNVSFVATGTSELAITTT